MVKLNRRLLPIKAHYFFFMAAMGPILPQLSVLGKQIGISPEVMGYLTSILPIMYVIAKPVFGFIVDYFSSVRKQIFLLLMITMTLSYGGFYFLPYRASEDMGTIDVSLKGVTILEYCRDGISSMPTSHLSNCSYGNFSYTAYILSPAQSEGLNLSSLTEPPNTHMCLPHNLTQVSAAEVLRNFVNGSCSWSPESDGSIYTTSTFWLFVTFMFVGTIGFNCVNSISDAICFDMLGENEEGKYGAQRVWGTIGFGATALIAGIVVDIWTLDDVKSFTPALIIMLIFSLFDWLSVSKLKLPKLSSAETIVKDVWDLMKHPSIAVFLVFATIAGIIDSFIIYFMFWHLEEVAAQTGYMHQIKLIEGCVVAAECLAGEVPFFFYSGKIIKKLGYVHCMSMCFFFYAVRLFLISCIPNPWYLVGVELFFQGVTYALCYTCIVAYAAAVAPPGTSATVQGLMAGMDDGLGFAIGSLIGGQALKHFGGRRSFKYFSVGAIVTCLAHILLRPASKKQQYLPKTGYEVPHDGETGSQVPAPMVQRHGEVDEEQAPLGKE